MGYEELLIEVENNLIIKEKPLKAYDGRIKGNKILIRNNMTDRKKVCVLAEEIGHYYTTVGDILDQSKVGNRKQEAKARLWAYDKLIGLLGIIKAYKRGCRSLHEMAEYLDVTEQFLADALERYRSKYGVFVTVDNYIVYFEPNLSVAEII